MWTALWGLAKRINLPEEGFFAKERKVTCRSTRGTITYRGMFCAKKTKTLQAFMFFILNDLAKIIVHFHYKPILFF